MLGGITRPAAGMVAVAVAVALSSAIARAGAEPDPTALANGLATSATHVVSLAPVATAECTYAGAGGVLVRLSDDRGATWSTGPCAPWITTGAALDPTSGLFVYGSSPSPSAGTSTSIVWMTGAGAVATEVAEPPSTIFLTADDGFAYVVGPGGLQRVGRDGSVFTCAPTPASIDTGQLVIPLADGVLVGTPRGPFAGMLSRDDCATFVPSPDLASCGDSVVPLGPDSVSCNTRTTAAYLDVRFDHLLHTVPLPVARFSPPYWSFDGDAAEVIDRLSTATMPQTWPTPSRFTPQPVVGDPPPSAAVASALAQLNARWRTPLGLPALSWSGLAAQVAYDHAYEWQLAGVLPAPNAGSETPGAPGFTGEVAQLRCGLAGIGGCIEIDEPGVTDAAAALTDALANPVAIFGILTGSQIGLGTTAAGSVADLPEAVDAGTLPLTAPVGTTFDFDLPANTPSSTIRVWPPDGATDVPSAWSNPGTLTFDPLAGVGDPPTVGSPIYVVADQPGTFQLRDALGMAVELTGYDVSAPSTTAEFNTWGAYPVTPLTPGGRYTIDLQPWVGPRQELGFTVAGGSPPTATAARAVRCTVAVRQVAAGRRTRLTLARRTSGCAGTRLEWRARAPRPWRTIGTRGIVAPAKRVLYWRAIVGARVLAHGRIVVRQQR